MSLMIEQEWNEDFTPGDPEASKDASFELLDDLGYRIPISGAVLRSLLTWWVSVTQDKKGALPEHSVFVGDLGILARHPNRMVEVGSASGDLLTTDRTLAMLEAYRAVLTGQSVGPWRFTREEKLNVEGPPLEPGVPLARVEVSIASLTALVSLAKASGQRAVTLDLHDGAIRTEWEVSVENPSFGQEQSYTVHAQVGATLNPADTSPEEEPQPAKRGRGRPPKVAG